MKKSAEQRDLWTRVTLTVQKPKVELLACGTKTETVTRQTRKMTEGVRMMGKLEGRRGLVELKGWRLKA